MKQRSQKTWFEIRLSAVIDPFLEEARQLCEEWKKIEHWLTPTAEIKHRCVSATEITNIIIFCGRTVDFSW